LFVGSGSGLVYSLDASSGCVHWYYDAKAAVRSAPLVERVKTSSGMRYAVIFGDQRAYMHAVDASTGQPLWKQQLDDYPVARITGSNVFYKGRVYVGVSSSEEGSGSLPTDECCRFRGSVVALDASSGKIVWKRYLVDSAKPRGKNNLGVQLWGPSGVPVWSSPAVDARLGRIYVTTGDNYSEPTSRYSDSFVALDANTGEILWARQMTAMDAYTSACRLPDHTNCPASNGPDYDFGSSPMLVNLPNGKRLLVAGQKSGIVHALDPDQRGKVVWQVRVGQGGTQGGVQWGQATDGTQLYVANADLGRIVVPFANNTDADPKRGGGMFALRLADGQKIWFTAPAACGDRPRCSPAQSGAVSAIAGIAFSGSYDGHLRAYSADAGKVVWDFDTERAYDSVNGEPGLGGSLDGAGPVIGGGLMFVNSGYAASGGKPGNVLLAFSVDGK
jgi:polyvinyl alcohol dehydrogenase (cytochrome)